MHMTNGLISPTVACCGWAVATAVTVYCAHRVSREKENRQLPLAGVMGAFIFAGQMLNFTIPCTGSRGHLVGGGVLAALLGPYAGFLIMAAVLAVQALFFADGGLLSLGCNIVNMGLFSCLIAYPFIYKPLTKGVVSIGRITLVSVLACVAGLQLGAFGVVLETTASGIPALPFSRFLGLMQPIHLAIGVVEGLATAAVLSVVGRLQPSLLTAGEAERVAQKAFVPVLATLAVAAMLSATVISGFASAYPDGLEWAVAKITGTEETVLAPVSVWHSGMDAVQQSTALMPDYAFPADGTAMAQASPIIPETGLAGALGSLMTVMLVLAAERVFGRRAVA